jgi:hypothetical protein
MLTTEQRTVLDQCWDDIQSLICAGIHRNRLSHRLDDILDDAITRTIESTARNNLTTVDAITSRARSCGLDAIESAARQHRNALLHRQAVEAGIVTIRGTAARPDLTRKITPRHFRPELFYAALTTSTEDGVTVPCLQFASYGAEFIQ